MVTVDDIEILSDERRVLVANKPFHLGSRAYDLLELLADARGKLVSKAEIMQHVWPDTIVVENNLHVHIAAIRKMLGPRSDLLIAVPGRGYRLAIELPRRQMRALPRTTTPKNDALSNLPPMGSKLFGRDSAILDGVRACCEASVVSIVGPGGIGKTRLAIEIARHLIPSFNDGVWMIELSKIAKGEFVAGEVASIFDPTAPVELAPLTSLAKALTGKQMLVLIDNCEHVIEAAADVAQTIATHAPSCVVLSTSREPLRVSGEQVYRVPALDVPYEADECPDPSETSSVKLFLERARAIDTGFAHDPKSISFAAAICRHLDGMPLAIELAASRAVTLGIEQLASNLDDRLALLNGGYRAALPQHQTLKATFDWSYDLLPNEERAVFRRIGVFPSSFALEAAEYITAEDGLTSADVLQAIGALTDKSLVIAEREQSATKYSLLETCRAYALQKLDDNGELQRVEGRFVSYVYARLRKTLSSVCTDSGAEVLEQFRPDLDDIRFALHCLCRKNCNRLLGAELIAMAAPLFFSLGLVSEIGQYAREVRGMWGKSEQAEISSDFRTHLLCAMAGESISTRQPPSLLDGNTALPCAFDQTVCFLHEPRTIL
jgi:predicted ATPase/DNA-binding winged helix-turn-helix (wHTH) protein